MQIAVLVFLFYTVGTALAFHEYGGYERLYYYYAYLLDAKINNGTPRKIATGCKKGGGICDFNEFLRFINIPAPTTNVPGLKDPFKPNIDDTADKLLAGDFTREYKPDIAEYISGNRDLVSQMAPDEFRNARLAIQRVGFLRAHENSNHCRLGLEKEHVRVIDKTKTPTYKDRNKKSTYQFVDIHRTALNNPGVDIRGMIDELNESDKHHKNVMAAKKAYGNLSCQ
ncbi:hypothetical protein FQN52_006908 [Onygenales sp. PD_12]|nr:hypothetical protein FQN53_005555 [Emmonsiellopsis sp. PD_33]KAK2788071.1 hypothetical protein FQN52_006908 [Onygenales sp. PD_12]KAK2805395.1 hypothetical protein FQN51_000221 [Onygenales sp. PD_10]